MKTKFDWNISTSGLTEHAQDALKNYFLYALPPGGFLTSVLNNDPVVDVYRRADNWNKRLIHKYIGWLERAAPEDSWGSSEAVNAWLAKGPAYQAFQKQLVWEQLNADHTEMKEPLF